MADFAQMIEQERERLGKLRDDLQAQEAGIAVKLSDLEKELQAISAYERVKIGKPERTPGPAKGTRAPRGRKREEIIDLITATPGMTRADLIAKLGIKGQTAQEQSISNALGVMKKAGTVVAEDGKYRMAGTG